MYAGRQPTWYWGLIGIPLGWLLIAQGVKRCHDIGKPWWWLIHPFALFWLLFTKGEAQANEFGPMQ
jgi:uncharacterized membrane protein YhaH (DUF805 family)